MCNIRLLFRVVITNSGQLVNTKNTWIFLHTFHDNFAAGEADIKAISLMKSFSNHPFDFKSGPRLV